MARVCVDACFLIGLYDARDQYHVSAVHDFSALFGESSPGHLLVIPWPILYECLGSRYARDPRKVDLLDRHWSYLRRAGRLIFIEDQSFREKILIEHLEDRLRPLSLVDRIIRAMILDPESHIDALVTYNIGDFADACGKKGIRLFHQNATSQEYGLR